MYPKYNNHHKNDVYQYINRNENCQKKPNGMRLPLIESSASSTTIEPFCLFDCDSSVSVSKNNVLNVTEDNYNSSVENINNFSNNTTMSSGQSCSQAAFNTNNVHISNINTPGNFTYGGSMTNAAKIFFDCVDFVSMTSEMSSSLMSEIMQGLENNNSSETLQKLEAEAAAASKSGFLSLGGSTSAKGQTFNNLKNYTTNNTNLRDVVAQSIANNFNAETFQTCTGQTVNSNNLYLEGIKAGSVTITPMLLNQTENITKCIQETNMGNSVLGNIANALKIKVENTTKNVSSQAGKSSSKSESINQGLNDLVDSVLGPLKSLGIVGMIVCLVIIIGVCGICGLSLYKTLINPEGGKNLTKITGQMEDAAVQGAQIGMMAVDPEAGLVSAISNKAASSLGKTAVSAVEQQGIQSAVDYGMQYSQPTAPPMDYSGYQQPTAPPMDYSGYQQPTAPPMDYSGYQQPTAPPMDYSGYPQSGGNRGIFSDFADSFKMLFNHFTK